MKSRERISKISNEEFSNQVSHNRVQFEYLFDNYTFDFLVKIEGAISDVQFTNCTFLQGLRISVDIDREVSFIECDFEGNVSMADRTFAQKVRFRSCNFYSKVNFYNTRFEDLTDFWSSTFHKSITFYKTDFFKNVVFSSVIFKQNVLFTYTLFNETAIMRGMKCEMGLDLSLAIHDYNFGIFDLDIFNYEALEDPSEEDYQSYIDLESKICIKNKIETFRILKVIASKSSDTLRHLEFHGIEQRTILEHSKTSKWDKVILNMNQLSNNHGVSIVRPIMLVLMSSIIFCYLSLLSTGSYQLGTNIFIGKDELSYYFQNLIPTHKVTFLDKEVPSGLFYISDFFGRLFISYGLFQFVRSFRKFKI